MKTNSALLPEAFRLMANGFSIIPVGKAKNPLVEWKQYQSKSANENQILEWWEKWPDANIGIVTGKISGIIVVDVDTYAGGDPKPFPETHTVQTGNGGLQLYYKYKEGYTISASGYDGYPHVDLRSDGGFVVAPPSVTDYIDKNTKQKKGGLYTILKNIPFAPFPDHILKTKKAKRSLTSRVEVGTGGRNDSIASVIGSLLVSFKEEEWVKEVWPTVQRINATYKPPLPQGELEATFNSICNKERQRVADLILSPMQFEHEGKTSDVFIRKNKSGTTYKDMSNGVAVLSEHPYYKNTIRYNDFKQEIEYNGKALEDPDITKIQYFMQTKVELQNMTRDAVYSAISHVANENHYDEAKEWLTNLIWDGTERLHEWVATATGVESGTYHTAVGLQWFMGMIRRVMEPGCIFDYVLVLVGPQGVGKTSLFRIIGGKWYKSFTGSMDNKDFYLTLRGVIVMDLDEGAAMYKSDAIKMKSIITSTHDEYRAPYDRVTKKYPRRFVFSMSTNDTEPFRDITGNRRYWTIDLTRDVNFKWLEENREQLFAEAYYYYKNKTVLPEVPKEEAALRQEEHLPDDSWTDIIATEVRKSMDYCQGSENYSTTVTEVYDTIFGRDKLANLGRGQEMRIAQIFKKELGLEKKRKMVDGLQKMRWYISDKKLEELQKSNAPVTQPEDFDL